MSDGAAQRRSMDGSGAQVLFGIIKKKKIHSSIRSVIRRAIGQKEPAGGAGAGSSMDR